VCVRYTTRVADMTVEHLPTVTRTVCVIMWPQVLYGRLLTTTRTGVVIMWATSTARMTTDYVILMLILSSTCMTAAYYMYVDYTCLYAMPYGQQERLLIAAMAV
jgi:hypothetical protein